MKEIPSRLSARERIARVILTAFLALPLSPVMAHAQSSSRNNSERSPSFLLQQSEALPYSDPPTFLTIAGVSIDSTATQDDLNKIAAKLARIPLEFESFSKNVEVVLASSPDPIPFGLENAEVTILENETARTSTLAKISESVTKTTGRDFYLFFTGHGSTQKPNPEANYTELAISINSSGDYIFTSDIAKALAEGVSNRIKNGEEVPNINVVVLSCYSGKIVMNAFVNQESQNEYVKGNLEQEFFAHLNMLHIPKEKFPQISVIASTSDTELSQLLPSNLFNHLDGHIRSSWRNTYQDALSQWSTVGRHNPTAPLRDNIHMTNSGRQPFILDPGFDKTYADPYEAGLHDSATDLQTTNIVAEGAEVFDNQATGTVRIENALKTETQTFTVSLTSGSGNVILAPSEQTLQVEPLSSTGFIVNIPISGGDFYTGTLKLIDEKGRDYVIYLDSRRSQEQVLPIEIDPQGITLQTGIIDTLTIPYKLVGNLTTSETEFNVIFFRQIEHLAEGKPDSTQHQFGTARLNSDGTLTIQTSIDETYLPIKGSLGLYSSSGKEVAFIPINFRIPSDGNNTFEQAQTITNNQIYEDELRDTHDQDTFVVPSKALSLTLNVPPQNAAISDSQSPGEIEITLRGFDSTQTETFTLPRGSSKVISFNGSWRPVYVKLSIKPNDPQAQVPAPYLLSFASDQDVLHIPLVVKNE